MTKLYSVRWEIDLDAESPLDAARQAMAIQRDPTSFKPIFEVRDTKTRKMILLDMEEDWDEQV